MLNTSHLKESSMDHIVNDLVNQILDSNFKDSFLTISEFLPLVIAEKIVDSFNATKIHVEKSVSETIKRELDSLHEIYEPKKKTLDKAILFMVTWKTVWAILTVLKKQSITRVKHSAIKKTIKSLPNKLFLNILYKQLGETNKPPKSIKKPICKTINFETSDIYLVDLMYSYKFNKNISRNPNSHIFFLHQLENDIIGILNDNILLMNDLSQDLKDRVPEATLEFMSRHEKDDEVFPYRIYTIWKMLREEKRVDTFKTLKKLLKKY
jgi:hypothetical protein